MSEPAPTPVDTHAQVSHEQDGRVLTGVGVTADQLAETMDRHAPPEAPETPDAAGTGGSLTPEGAAPVEAPPVSRGRQRFADLTRERDAAREEAKAAADREAAVARERDEFKARISQPAPASAPAPAAVALPAEPAPTRPEPTEDEIGTKYKTYAEFARDLARWVVEQDRAQAATTVDQRVREILAQERQQHLLNTTAQQTQDRGRKAYADFDTLLNGPAGQVPMGRTQPEAIERALFILRHPQSEHVQYAILKDLTLAERLRDSDPYTFATTIAGLVPAEPSAPAKPAWTPPPAPAPTVGASSPTTPTASRELAQKGDYEGYRQRRAAERGVKPRYR